MQRVTTHQARPSAAPEIQESKMVNISTVFISWSKIEDQHHNGPLTGYQVKKIDHLYYILTSICYKKT